MKNKNSLQPYISPRESIILGMRFGLVDGVTHTYEEVGQEFDVTRERIREIECKALNKIHVLYVLWQKRKKMWEKRRKKL